MVRLMDLSDLQPIQNEPALFIKNKKILIVADLHIGIESQLREQGLSTSSKTQNLIDRILEICKKYKPFQIILLGDIKHNIPSSTIQERKDVKNFLNTLSSYGNVHIVPGNHDGNIGKISPQEIIIHPSDGFKIENIGFVHGHRWPKNDVMECDQLILSHTHPTIMFTDRLGHKTFESCWIKGSILKEKLVEKYPNATCSSVLVIPSFNPLCGGIAANQEGIAGPIGKLIDIENAQIYLIDGTSLGKVKLIK
jgi:putative SbcD/Mre11-related phosphoesterase